MAKDGLYSIHSAPELKRALIALEARYSRSSLNISFVDSKSNVPESSWYQTALAEQFNRDAGLAVIETPKFNLVLASWLPLPDEFRASPSLESLLDRIDHPESILIILLRLGHYAMGIARGRDLIVSKCGSRYVKGKHRKGGQSSNRFVRDREKWIRELFDKATVELHNNVLGNYEGPIDRLVYGGDRIVLGKFQERSKLSPEIQKRLLTKFVPVDQPGLVALKRAAALLTTWQTWILDREQSIFKDSADLSVLV